MSKNLITSENLWAFLVSVDEPDGSKNYGKVIVKRCCGMHAATFVFITHRSELLDGVPDEGSVAVTTKLLDSDPPARFFDRLLSASEVEEAIILASGGGTA
jgi:hypothetical protein